MLLRILREIDPIFKSECAAIPCQPWADLHVAFEIGSIG
jgi:hypothetical protein